MNGWPDEPSILTTFRDWLDQVKAETDGLEEDGPLEEGPVDSRTVGLFDLAEAMTALRHEVKLGTKSMRALDERAEAMVEAMEQAIAQFRSVSARETEAARQAARPFVEAVIDLDEALRRGQQVIQTARARARDEWATQAQKRIADAYQRRWWLRRWLSRRWYRLARTLLQEQTETLLDQLLDPLLAGYQLIVNRLQRVMEEEGIHRMHCVGKPVDPNAMTVIEVIEDPEKPPGLVVDEVRAGYYWKAQVFRYAEVRAIRARPRPDEEPDNPLPDRET